MSAEILNKIDSKLDRVDEKVDKHGEALAKVEVHIDQIPPYKQRAKRFPSCYHKQRYVYLKP